MSTKSKGSQKSTGSAGMVKKQTTTISGYQPKHLYKPMQILQSDNNTN